MADSVPVRGAVGENCLVGPIDSRGSVKPGHSASTRYVRDMAESCDVVIIGAGLTGLVAARVLCGAGLHVIVIDSADAPGGRIRTDSVDGMLLDRGFQLLNPKYPQAARTFNLRALRLHPFEAGAVVAHGHAHHVLADPRRMPGEALGALRVPLGSVRERVASRVTDPPGDRHEGCDT